MKIVFRTRPVRVVATAVVLVLLTPAIGFAHCDGMDGPVVQAGGAFERAGISGSGGCTGDRLLCGDGAAGYEPKSSSWGGAYLVAGGIEFRIAGSP